jgi:catechol 2,3-dioxygenase-like lactoylglutathione lyase family enzyme
VTIPNRISAISLFVDDVAASKAFYATLFGVAPINEDDVSAALRFGETVINLLHRDSAHEIVAPDRVGARGEGSQFQLTVWLDDLDAAVAELRRHGIAFNGPIERPWGLRTVNFVDPSGHSWEVAQRISRGQ